ncbi:MAG: hypothetical protein GY861_15575 [bacterium]|nr:hypothetical protein [bacterium]
MSAGAYYKCPECQTGNENDETVTLASYEDLYIENGYFVADIKMECSVCGYEFMRTFREKMPAMEIKQQHGGL